MEQVDVGLDLLGNADTLLQTVALGHELRTKQPELDGEEGPYRRPDGLQYLNGEPATVFQGAAVLVGALVEHGGTGTD